MTIREALKHRRKVFQRVFVTTAMVLLGAWVLTHPRETNGQFLIRSLPVVVVVIIALTPITNRLFSCPRCGSNFRKYRIQKLGRFSLDTTGAEDLWDACPQCGVSFEERYSG